MSEIGLPRKVHEIEVVPGFEPVPSTIPVPLEEPAEEPATQPV